MATEHVTQSKNLVAAAAKLERLERGLRAIDPDHFRTLVEILKAELTAAQPGEHLDAVLATFQCASELYENMNYEHAGLCRSSLDAALRGEMEAREAITAAFSSKRS